MIKLVPMTELEFEMYLQYNIQAYAQDQAQSGRESEEEGVEEGTQQYHHLLPQGLQTADHSLNMIVSEESGRNIGILWFDQREQMSGQQIFVNDIVIFEEFRRRGYARQAMRLLEKQATELGASSIGVRHFGDNESARILYAKLKYTMDQPGMSKNL